MHNHEIIRLAFTCKERRGTFERNVFEVEPSKPLREYLRLKLAPIPSPVKDLSKLTEPGVRTILVDNVGVIIQGTTLLYGVPDVHIGFWDRILVGREQMCYHVGLMLARDAGVDALWTAIPMEARATLAFARRVGFKIIQEVSGAYVLMILFHDATRRP